MNFIEAIGRFHPLIVHLPIGILVLGLLLAVVSYREQYTMLRPAVSFSLFWGAIGAILSCILGYMLSLSGGYDADLLSKHQRTGIGCAVVASAAWLLYRFNTQLTSNFKFFIWVFTVGSLAAAGHYGGSLTHGSDYLTELWSGKKKKKDIASKSLESIDSQSVENIFNSNINPNDSLDLNKIQDKNGVLSAAKTANTEGLNLNIGVVKSDTAKAIVESPKMVMAYNELIQPILEQRCYNCHGTNKSKADLRLDSPDFIKNGSENGAVVVAGNPQKSPLFTTLVLPLEDDMHMPPEGKPQLTDQQVKLIHWWIENGASFDKPIALGKSSKASIAVPTPSVSAKETPLKAVADISKTTTQIAKEDDIKPVERILENKENIILKQNIGSIEPDILKKLEADKIIIAKFSEASPYVMANFVNVKNYNINLLNNLKNIDNQLVRLRLSNQPVKDADLEVISKFKNITRLNLEKTQITDAGLAYLKNMPNLEQLNIYGTNVTDKGLKALADCKNLKIVYLWETKTTPSGINNLKKILRGIEVDTGGIKFPKPDTLSVKKN
jgi:uncharacterized membrane protein/mono/diheme cytochrome c family protein